MFLKRLYDLDGQCDINLVGKHRDPPTFTININIIISQTTTKSIVL